MKMKILGTGSYLPKKTISSEQMEKDLSLPKGSILKQNGVITRHIADQESGETTSQMCAWAAQEALQRANLNAQDIDLIIFASAGPEQAIPDTAPLVQNKLGLGSSGITCFSVHSTCLSVLTALDISAHFIAAKRYRCILIVSCEIPSTSINPEDDKTYALLGDAAAAVIVGATPDDESSVVHNIHFSTFGEAALLTEVRGCGTRYHPNASHVTSLDNTFRMNGGALLKFALRKANLVLEKIWPGLSKSCDGIDVVITHQPSKIGLTAFARYFKSEKTVFTLEKYGNCVSVSLPLTLHEAIITGRLKRGDKTLLFGTGAGLTIAGIVLSY
jgi:3-oxoacyl-[acyl-carrier-protein] synthase III